jgi:hypothetical protein
VPLSYETSVDFYATLLLKIPEACMRTWNITKKRSYVTVQYGETNGSSDELARDVVESNGPSDNTVVSKFSRIRLWCPRSHTALLCVSNSHANVVWEVDYEAVECVFMPCFLKGNIQVVVLVTLFRTNRNSLVGLLSTCQCYVICNSSL